MRRLSRLSSFPLLKLWVAIVAIPIAGAVVACTDVDKAAESASPVLAQSETKKKQESPEAIPDVVAVAFAEAEVQPVVPASPKADTDTSAPVLDLLAEEALYHDAADAEDYAAKAEALSTDGRFGEAVNARRHALYDDGTAQNWASLGAAYLLAEEPQRGRRALEQALSIDPKHVGARQKLVRLHLDEGQSRKAKEHADLLVRHAPDDVSGRYLAGLAYMKNAMWKQAIEQMEEVTAVEPQNIYAHNNAGFAAIQLGDVQTALVHLEPIAQLADAHGYMLNNLGVAYERAGRLAEAHAAFSRAVELRPGYVNGVINRERVAKGMTESDQALSAEVLIGLRTPADAGARERVAKEDSHDDIEAEANAPSD